MSAKEPTSKIPQSKGYIAPEVKTVVKPVTHYNVNENTFLKKSQASKVAKASNTKVIESNDPIEVYEVDSENFATFEEAEKKRNLLVRKHRDDVRSAAKIFGVERASLVEKNVRLKWLLANYSIEEIFDFYDVKSGNHNWGKTAHRAFFNKYPNLDLTLVQRDKKWSWLQNRNIDSYWGIPQEYQAVGPLRTAWVYGERDLRDKIELIKQIVNSRILELLYFKAEEMNDFGFISDSQISISLQELDSKIDFDLIADEVEDLNKVLDTTELGKDLLIELKKGEVVYSVASRPKNLNPFKRF